MNLRDSLLLPLIAGLAGILAGLIPYNKIMLDVSPDMSAMIVDTERLLPGTPYPLEVPAEVERQNIRVGQSLPVRFYLRNASAEPILVLRPHDGGHGGCWPRGSLEIRDQQSSLQKIEGLWRCGTHDPHPLMIGHFDPLAAGARLKLDHYMLGWEPRRPGVYRIQFTYDTRGEIPKAWEIAEPGRPSTISYLKQMPQGLFTSKVVTLVVTD